MVWAGAQNDDGRRVSRRAVGSLRDHHVVIGWHGSSMARPRTLSRRGLSTYQSACKPGSVGRDCSRATAIPLGDRLLGPSGNLPGRRRGSTPGVAPCRPYSVLLPVGFAVPLPLPVARWALTPPFHPCRGMPRRSLLCGTVPGVAPAGRYPAPCFRGARTFLPRALSGDAAAAVRPADGRQVRQSRRSVKAPGSVSPQICGPSARRGRLNWTRPSAGRSPGNSLPGPR
jgi:hypothetical protein